MVVGNPQSDKDIVDDWLHLLLACRKDALDDSMEQVNIMLMKWHCKCTPLSEH